MNIYVGNLPQTTNETELKDAFAAYGVVGSTAVIKDKATGNSRGFGFVEMSDQTEAQAAIERLNGSEVGGQMLKVRTAKSRDSVINKAYRQANRG